MLRHPIDALKKIKADNSKHMAVLKLILYFFLVLLIDGLHRQFEVICDFFRKARCYPLPFLATTVLIETFVVCGKCKPLNRLENGLLDHLHGEFPLSDVLRKSLYYVERSCN